VDGITVQDLNLHATSLPTPRGGVIIQNNSGTRHGGYIIQRNNIGGIRYYQSTAPTGGQGTNGGNIFWEGYPGTGGIENISILNNTICGLSGPTSADDAATAGFGNDLNIYNTVIRGNITCNIGGGPIGQGGGNVAYPPMGDGIHLQAMRNGALAEFNLAHDLGANMINCGGPVGHITAQVDGAIIQFSEAYAVQPSTYVGGCDWDSFDLDHDSVNSTLQYNYSHGNFNAGYLLFMQAPMGIGWGPATVRFNISENDSQGGFTGFGCITWVAAYDVVTNVYNNTCWNNTVYHGVLYQTPGEGGVGFTFQTGTSFHGVIANNIVGVGYNIFRGWEPINNASPGYAPAFSMLNNDYFTTHGGDPYIRWGNVDYYSFASYQAASGKDQNSITSVPTFTGIPPSGTCSWTPSLHNGPQPCPAAYHLDAGPAVGGGVNLTAGPYNFTITRDYYGNAVPGTGNCWNIGAWGACP
jgi:hypothetical protein